MEEIVNLIQNSIVKFCSQLPSFVDTWRGTLMEMKNDLRILSNYSIQLLSVEKVNIIHMENFEIIQEKLQATLLENMEQDLESLKGKIQVLKKANDRLKSFLSSVESATINLDWDYCSVTVKGGPLQPPLVKLLQSAYTFWIFFSKKLETINHHFNCFNIRNHEQIEDFKNTVSNTNFNSKDVNSLLALTQYIK